MIKLDWYKVGSLKYELRTPEGEAVAIAEMTGDELADYPWDAYPLDGWRTAQPVGAQESLRKCVEVMSEALEKDE